MTSYIQFMRLPDADHFVHILLAVGASKADFVGRSDSCRSASSLGSLVRKIGVNYRIGG